MLTYVEYPPDASDFQLVDRKVHNAMRQIDDAQPFMRLMTFESGFRSVGIKCRWLARKHGKSRNRWDWIFAVAIVACSIALIIQTIWMLDRGFEFTDQSFYLMSMQRPAEYDFIYGFWPYALEPLYKLVGGSISSIQRIAAGILVTLGGTAGIVALMKLRVDPRGPAGSQVIATAMSLPLGYYTYWLAIPGYNWFALVGGLCLLISVLFLCGEEGYVKSASFAGAAAICALFARPQNVLSFGAIYLAAVLVARRTARERIVQIVWAACVPAIGVLILLVSFPVETIVSQVREYNTFFGTTHPIKYSLIDQQWEYLNSARLFVASGCLLTAFLLWRRRKAWLEFSAFAVSLAILFIIFRRCVLHPDEYTAGGSVGAVALASLLVAYIVEREKGRLIAVLAIASLIPWAATAGSSNPTLPQLAFFVGLSNIVALAAFVMIGRRYKWMLTVACCVSLYVTFSLVQHGMASPFRLAAPLSLQSKPTKLGWGSELKLDVETSQFVDSLQAIATEGGFCRGDPAIDLSGALPGSVFAMGGRMPIFPWIFAGYPFSGHFAEQYLKKVGESTLYRSWLILNEKTGNFSKQQIQTYGVDFTRFRLAGDLRHPVDGTSVKLYAPLAVKEPCG